MYQCFCSYLSYFSLFSYTYRQDKVIADIFGSSDDEDEFEGFDASEVPKKEKKKKTGS